MIDLHSHILPGVDDGAMSMEDALEIVAQAAASGFRKIVATPHYFHGQSTPIHMLNETFSALSDAVKREKIKIALAKSMEIFAGDHLPDLLKAGEVWTYPNSSYFLVEFPYDEEEKYFDWLLDRCFNEGFIPVIAHPERYRAVRHNPKMAQNWVQKGYGVQINRDSLLGLFGEQAYQCANILLRKGWANCIASDAHEPEKRNCQWQDSFCQLPAIYGFSTLARCMEINPWRILNNLPLIDE